MVRNPSGDGGNGGGVDVAAALLSPRLRNVAAGRVRAAVVGLAIGAELVCLTVIVLSAAGGNRILVPAARHASPAWLHGPLPALQQRLSSTDIGVLLATMVLGYGVALALAARVPGRWPLAVAGGAIALCWLAPPLLSADVFGYVAWGELGAHGVNPYRHASIDAVRPFLLWDHGTTPYGPLFTAMTFALAPLSVGAALWTLKTVAASARLAASRCCGARRRSSSGRRRGRRSPSDSIRSCSCTASAARTTTSWSGLAGVLAVVAGRERTGAGAVVAAAAMKASAVVALPFLVAGSRRWRRPALAAVATGAVLVACGFALFGTPLLHLVGAIGAEQQDVAVHSVQAEIARLAGSSTLPSWGHLLAGGLLLAAVVALLYRVRRGADWLTGAGWAYVAVLVTTAWLLPWYVAWALPFAALSADRRLLGAVWALTLSIAVLRLPVFA
jgi:hypothetical protein